MILGNGSHVEEIWDDVQTDTTFEEAHRKIDYEPDPRIYTPRISATAALTRKGAQGFVTAGAVSDPHWPRITQHRTLHIESPAPGQGQLVTTYVGDLDSPQPNGNPVVVRVESGWESIVSELWAVLDPNLKVAVGAFPLQDASFLSEIVKKKH